MRNTTLTTGDDVEHALEARKHLVQIRDKRPANDPTSKKVDSIVGQIEQLLGY